MARGMKKSLIKSSLRIATIGIILFTTKVRDGKKKALDYSVKGMKYLFKRMYYTFSNMYYMVRTGLKAGMAGAFTEFLGITPGEIRRV